MPKGYITPTEWAELHGFSRQAGVKQAAKMRLKRLGNRYMIPEGTPWPKRKARTKKRVCCNRIAGNA